MTSKQRLAQLERQKPKAKMTWKEFIESDGKTWDAETKAAWAEFIASQDIGNDVQKELHGKG